MVRAGTVSLNDGRKLAALKGEARKTAVAAVNHGADIRAAVRAAKKQDYNAKVAAAKPKALQGTYRIIYADPCWKYHGLNQADEYGHAERHYDCLDDDELCWFRPGQDKSEYHKGGKGQLVKDLADKDAVLFLWVPSPMLIRCAEIIEKWGFKYKASFVWDKVLHNMGHYNSVRHEMLLICTRGSCKPDVSELKERDSVQSIERSSKHSEKPAEFYKLIEGMYTYGRKLELFARSGRKGWDSIGNEASALSLAA